MESGVFVMSFFGRFKKTALIQEATLELPSRLRVGLALGGGAARGWAHVGVIRALSEKGIHPDLVCGTSIGALVGAVLAAGEMDRFERWLLDMGVKQVFSLLDVTLNGGMLKGERLMEHFRLNFVDRPIQDLSLPYGAVATSLHSGVEIWLREGSTVEAVRASIAMPGLLTPVQRLGDTLVDGGLVNPIPVSLARAMGAEFVIAVDLSADMFANHRQKNGGQARPSLREVLAGSINVMQVRIARSRLAGDPPDVLLTPKVSTLGFFDFHRAAEAIEIGRRCVEDSLPFLEGLSA